MKVGVRLKKFLDENRITCYSVANRVGIPEDDFVLFLNGEGKITADEYYKICNLLKVPLDMFMEK